MSITHTLKRIRSRGFWGRKVFDVDETKLGSSRQDQGWNDGRMEVEYPQDAVLVSSQVLHVDGEPVRHMPVLDLDIPHHYVTSTTPGHGHLYLDVPLDTNQYEFLLHTLADLGIIQQGYYDGWRARGATFARLPWVFKHPVDPDPNDHITGYNAF